MIPSAKDYLTMWYQDWKAQLDRNLDKQAVLKADEATLRELVGTCEAAFGMLFPAPQSEEKPNGPDNGDTTPSDLTSPN